MVPIEILTSNASVLAELQCICRCSTPLPAFLLQLPGWGLSCHAMCEEMSEAGGAVHKWWSKRRCPRCPAGGAGRAGEGRRGWAARRSASGAIITEAFASSFPTMVAFVVDTPRCASPQVFMSNMLQVGSLSPPRSSFAPPPVPRRQGLHDEVMSTRCHGRSRIVCLVK